MCALKRDFSLKKAVLLLSDGAAFYGRSIGGAEGSSFGEICFNTGMTGYQEVFTDPSYFGQIVVMSGVHIGNYGTVEGDAESDRVNISGLVCKNFSYVHSRVAPGASLKAILDKNGLLGICNVDTRALVSYVRDHGAMNAAISTEVDELDMLKKRLDSQPDMNGLELASKVSTKSSYTVGDSGSPYRVALVDLGLKRSILKNLTSHGVYVKVFPYDCEFEEVSKWNPHGYMLSNGPGDPRPLKVVRDFVKRVIAAKRPLFGICLGHQIIALANGVSTFKMSNGHRGINHPVINENTGRGEITSQNHGFAVVRDHVERHSDLKVSHLHLNDGTIAGMEMRDAPCFSVQYHPEAGPGPSDAKYLFGKFIKMMERFG